MINDEQYRKNMLRNILMNFFGEIRALIDAGKYLNSTSFSLNRFISQFPLNSMLHTPMLQYKNIGVDGTGPEYETGVEVAEQQTDGGE